MNKPRACSHETIVVTGGGHAYEAQPGMAGALAGAAMGAFAGGPGVLAGAILGGLVGSLAGGTIAHESTERAAADPRLDVDLGVCGGELGAPNLRPPPAGMGMHSQASTGVEGSTASCPAEGPMSPPAS